MRVNKNKAIDPTLIPFLNSLAYLIVDSYEQEKERSSELIKINPDHLNDRD